MLSTIVNAHSTSVALIIVTFCYFIAIKIQAEIVSNKISKTRTIKTNSKVTENKSTHLF